MSNYPIKRTATSKRGETIERGTKVSLVDVYDGTTVYPPVLVVEIHGQGKNGTILTTRPAPCPQFPHHFTCRASAVIVAGAAICKAEPNA